MGCSQGMNGFLDPTVLDEYKDDNGSSFREAANAVGLHCRHSQGMFPT